MKDIAKGSRRKLCRWSPCLGFWTRLKYFILLKAVTSISYSYLIVHFHIAFFRPLIYYGSPGVYLKRPIPARYRLWANNPETCFLGSPYIGIAAPLWLKVGDKIQ